MFVSRLRFCKFVGWVMVSSHFPFIVSTAVLFVLVHTFHICLLVCLFVSFHYVDLVCMLFDELSLKVCFKARCVALKNKNPLLNLEGLFTLQVVH